MIGGKQLFSLVYDTRISWQSISISNERNQVLNNVSELTMGFWWCGLDSDLYRLFYQIREICYCSSVGFRTNAGTCDLSAILPENVEQEVKEQAEISMGSEISDDDINNITHLCDQVNLHWSVEVHMILLENHIVYCLK